MAGVAGFIWLYLAGSKDAQADTDA